MREPARGASASVVSQSDDGSSSSTTADKAVERKATAPHWPSSHGRRMSARVPTVGTMATMATTRRKRRRRRCCHSTTGKENAGAARARLARMSPEERRLLWIGTISQGMLREALDLAGMAASGGRGQRDVRMCALEVRSFIALVQRSLTTTRAKKQLRSQRRVTVCVS